MVASGMTIASRVQGNRILCGTCGSTLAHRERDGLVWWISGWHRQQVPLENPERNRLTYSKPHRSHRSTDTVMDFHRPLEQVCRECGAVNDVP